MVLCFYIFLVTGDVVCLHGLVFSGKCPVDKSLTHSFWLGVLILLMSYPRQFSFLLWCFQLVLPFFDTVLFPSLCSFFPSALAGGLLVSPQHDRLLYKEKKDCWAWCLSLIGMVGTSASYLMLCNDRSFCGRMRLCGLTRSLSESESVLGFL